MEKQIFNKKFRENLDSAYCNLCAEAKINLYLYTLMMDSIFPPRDKLQIHVNLEIKSFISATFIIKNNLPF
jgi:hypothetical protein